MGQAGQKLLFVSASLIETCDAVTHTYTVWTLTYNLEKITKMLIMRYEPQECADYSHQTMNGW